MTKKKLMMWGFGLSAFHLVITLFAFCIAYNDTMDDFDRGERTSPTQTQKVAHVLTPILMQPVLSLWTPWMAKHTPLLVQHFLFFANSMLWGFGVIVVLKGLCEAVRHLQIGSIGSRSLGP